MWKALLAIVIASVVGIAALVAAVWVGMTGPPPLLPPERGTTVFDGVVLIEPGSGRRRAKRLEVAEGRIAEIGSATLNDTGEPTGQGPYTGAFVLPGLIDAHVHFPPPVVPGQTELFAFLYLAHGITGVRSLGDVGADISDLARERAANLEFAAPRIATCGRFVDSSPPLWSNSVIVDSPEDARAAIDALADRGYDCIKVYNQLDARTLAADREASHARELPVRGHLPYRVRHYEAHHY
jgi:hypothetical protein